MSKKGRKKDKTVILLVKMWKQDEED